MIFPCLLPAYVSNMLPALNVAKHLPYFANGQSNTGQADWESCESQSVTLSRLQCTLQRQRHPLPARSVALHTLRTRSTHTRRQAQQQSRSRSRQQRRLRRQRNEKKRNEPQLALALPFATQSALSPCRCLLANGCVAYRVLRV